MLEDITLVQLMFDSIGGIPTTEELESWQRIKKAALESCQQSGEAPVQQLKAEIAALVNEHFFTNENGTSCSGKYGVIAEKMRQLSAV